MADMTFEIKLESIDLKPSEWMKVFKSQEMRDELQRRAEAIASAAAAASSADPMDNPPFVGNATIGDKTALGIVAAATPHGVYAKERILDAIGAGGG